MSNYHWNDVSILNETNDWSYSKFKQIEKETGLHAIERLNSRENLARAFMLACGYSLEKTFENDDSSLTYFGQQLIALLETASGNEAAEYNDKILQAAQTAQLSKRFFLAFPEIKEQLDQEKAAEPDSYDDKKWANRIIEEMYYIAMKKIAEIPYPKIDFTNLEQLRSCSDKYNAIADIEINLNQGYSDELKKRLAARHDDFLELDESLAINTPIHKAMMTVGIELGDPIEQKKLGEALKGRITLDLFGENLAGISSTEASKFYTLDEIVTYPKQASPFVLELNPKLYPQIKDYIEAKPGSIVPFYKKEDAFVISAAYDYKIPTLALSKLPQNQSKAETFHQIFANFEENPTVHSESVVKRIYIDGKNAYDLLKNKYQGTEAEIEERIKEDIVQTLMDAKSRVELARMDLTRDGRPKATVVPVKADLSPLDVNKKWYETSHVKKATKLWNDDPDRKKRTAAIAEKAEERQRNKMLSNAYQSSFYTSIFNEMVAIHKEYKKSLLTFSDAEQKLKQNPDAAREWMLQRTATMYKTADTIRDLSNPDKTLKEIQSDPSLASILTEEIILARENTDVIFSRLQKNIQELKEKGELNEAEQERVAYLTNKLEESKLEIQDEVSQRMNEFDHFTKYGKSGEEIAALPEQRTISSMGDFAKLHELDKQFLGEGVHNAADYAAFQKVHDCNIKVMETMTAKMQELISSEKEPDSFRNDIRSIRSLMEAVGICQEDMNKYGETLTGKQKETFDHIRNWETRVLKGSSLMVMPPAEGTANIKDCVSQMLNLYRNAYYDKLGYPDQLDAASIDHMARQLRENQANKESAKKQISFDALTKSQNIGKKEARPQTLTKSVSPAVKEKTNDMVNGK